MGINSGLLGTNMLKDESEYHMEVNIYILLPAALRDVFNIMRAQRALYLYRPEGF